MVLKETRNKRRHRSLFLFVFPMLLLYELVVFIHKVLHCLKARRQKKHVEKEEQRHVFVGKLLLRFDQEAQKAHFRYDPSIAPFFTFSQVTCTVALATFRIISFFILLFFP